MKNEQKVDHNTNVDIDSICNEIASLATQKGFIDIDVSDSGQGFIDMQHPCLRDICEAGLEIFYKVVDEEGALKGKEFGIMISFCPEYSESLDVSCESFLALRNIRDLFKSKQKEFPGIEIEDSYFEAADGRMKFGVELDQITLNSFATEGSCLMKSFDTINEALSSMRLLNPSSDQSSLEDLTIPKKP